MNPNDRLPSTRRFYTPQDLDGRRQYGDSTFIYARRVADHNDALDTSALSSFYLAAAQHKRLVAALAFLGLIAGYVSYRLKQPTYRAQVTLEILNVNDNFLSLRDVSPTAVPNVDSDVLTQAKLLESNSLRKRATTRLNTTELAKPMSPAARDRATRAILVASKNVKVGRVADRTRIIDVVCDAPDPSIAAAYANTLAEEFVEAGLESRLTGSQQTNNWLSKQLADMKDRLERSQQELQSYANTTGLLFTQDKASLAEEKLRQIQQDLSRSQTELVFKQARFELATSAPAESLPEVLDNASLREYQMKIAELKRQLAELSTTLTPAHYKVERVQSQLAAIQPTYDRERSNVTERIRNEYQDAKRRADLLSNAYRQQATLVSTQASKAVHYDILKREVDTNRQLYDTMLQKVREAGVASALRAPSVRVVDPAEPPEVPHRPSRTRHVGAGLFAGLMAGLMVVFVRSRVERSIREPGEATALLDTPELGVIVSAGLKPGYGLPNRYLPFVRKKGEPPVIRTDGMIGGLVEGASSPESSMMLIESFRSTVTSVLLSEPDSRVVVLASPCSMDGKSTVATNFAISLAATGRRILLVDGDLRRPVLHRILDVPNPLGTIDLLKSRTVDPEAISKVIQSTSTEGLFVLPGRNAAADVNHLFGPAPEDLMRVLRREFDMVIVDTPAMLNLADARVFGRLADGVILVLRAGYTDREAAWLVRQRFQQDGTAILGTILNDWNPKTATYGYYRSAMAYSK